MKFPWRTQRPVQRVVEEIDPPAPEPSIQTQKSPGLEEALKRIPDPESCKILDLGPAVGGNVEFLASVARHLRIVDAFDRRPTGGRPAGVDVDRAVQSLWDLLPGAAASYHLVLTWDLFNYIPENRLASVVELLAEISQPGARLHAIVAASDTIPAFPNRYRIVDHSKLIYEGTTNEVCGARQMPPAEVEKMLEHFRIEHSFLLRHGVREYVAVRDE